MAGTALTDAFMLGTATVMIGAQSALFDLDTTKSIGLVKGFTLSAAPAYVELTQGVKNTVVASVLNSNPVTASMQAFEYTAKNLEWALGLDGSSVTAFAIATTLASSMTSSAVANVHAGDGSLFTVGDYVVVDANGDDEAFVRKVSSIATDAITLDHTIATAPSGAAFRKVHAIGVGSKTDQPFLSAKVVGKLSNGDQVVILIPKLRISKGFSMAFASDQFGNMPFEFTVYDLVSTDTNYAWFGGDSARIMRT